MPPAVLTAGEQRGPGHLGARASVSDISTWHSQGTRPDPGQPQTILSGFPALPCPPAPRMWYLRPKPPWELLQGWSWRLRAQSWESPAAFGAPGLPGCSPSAQPCRGGAGGQSWQVGAQGLSPLLSLRPKGRVHRTRRGPSLSPSSRPSPRPRLPGDRPGGWSSCGRGEGAEPGLVCMHMWQHHEPLLLPCPFPRACAWCPRSPPPSPLLVLGCMRPA